MKIDLCWLQNQGICLEEQEKFSEIFGKNSSVSPKEMLKSVRLAKRSDWEAWLLSLNPELTQELIKEGANIHTEEGVAIYWATIKGRLNVVQYLVEKGANIRAHNNFVLRLAIMRSRLEIAQFLKERVNT